MRGNKHNHKGLYDPSYEHDSCGIGFVHLEHGGVLENSEVKLDDRGNIATTGFQTTRDGLFAAGDARRGQSLVVWAIA